MEIFYQRRSLEPAVPKLSTFCDEVCQWGGPLNNLVMELYITEFTSRNALVWKQLVSYLCLLPFRLWPSFLRSLHLWNCRFSRPTRTRSWSRSRSLSGSTIISWLVAYFSFPRRRQSFIWGGSFSDEILIIITTSLSLWGRNIFHSQLRKATLLSDRKSVV